MAFTPTPLVLIALLGWAPLMLLVFHTCGPARGRRAVMITFIGGILFLPMAGIPIPSFIPYDKVVAVSVSALLGVFLFDPLQFTKFQLRPVDWIMVLWCLSPMGAIFINTEAIAAKEGILEVLKHTFTWGIPYFIGRLYFSSYLGLYELARGIFIGGLIYVPFCLWEIRFSPQLHFKVYGYMQHDFSQVMRLDGYRPMVFMYHGLAVGMWMAVATLAGFWLWKTGAVKRLYGIKAGTLLIILAGTTVACKSTGALVLLVVGIAALYLGVWTRRAALLLVVLAIPPAYMFARTAGGWSGHSAVETAESFVGKERASSLAFRMDMEDLLIAKAMQKPMFGWGPAGRNLIHDAYGALLTIPDGMWMICIGPLGFCGLIAFFACLLVPVWMMYRKLPAAIWGHPRASGAVAMGMTVALYAIHNLLNAIPNPVFYLAVGGLAGTFSATTATRRRAVAQRRGSHTGGQSGTPSGGQPVRYRGQAPEPRQITPRRSQLPTSQTSPISPTNQPHGKQ